MTTLADDFNALVESQSGAEELPDMNTVENDGAAFDKACSLSLTAHTDAPLSGPDGRPGERVPLA